MWNKENRRTDRLKCKLQSPDLLEEGEISNEENAQAILTWAYQLLHPSAVSKWPLAWIKYGVASGGFYDRILLRWLTCRFLPILLAAGVIVATAGMPQIGIALSIFRIEPFRQNSKDIKKSFIRQAKINTKTALSILFDEIVIWCLGLLHGTL